MEPKAHKKGDFGFQAKSNWGAELEHSGAKFQTRRKLLAS